MLLRGINTLDASDMSLMRAAGSLICALLFWLLFPGGVSAAAVGENLPAFAALVLCNNVIGDVFLFFALHKLGVARGAAISSSYPIPVAIASHFLFGAPLTMTVVAGTLCVVAGVALLCHRDSDEGRVSASGLLCAVLASLFWAAGLLFNKLLVARGLSPLTIVAGRAAAFFTIAAALWLAKTLSGKGRTKPRALLCRESLMGLAAGVLSLGFGAWLYSSALEYVPPTVATPIGASNPVVASIAAMYLYKEKIRRTQWGGIALAVGGSVLVSL